MEVGPSLTAISPNCTNRHKKNNTMLGLSFWEIFLIGAVALVVLGPERLPKTARTIGTLIGRAQRYVNDVKAEVSRSIDMEELHKMKSTVEDAARDMEHTMSSTAQDFERSWSEAKAGLDGSAPDPTALLDNRPWQDASGYATPRGSSYNSHYKAPRKNWRNKRSAIPQWYKQRSTVRSKVQSGAARVARFRPKGVTASRVQAEGKQST